MTTTVQKVAIRQNAIYISGPQRLSAHKLKTSTANLLSKCNRYGFTFSEDLLRAINTLVPGQQYTVYQTLSDILGAGKNWTPLRKNWQDDITDELDYHQILLFNSVENILFHLPLPCGHTIPQRIFPLHKYNGCPLCGTPTDFSGGEYHNEAQQFKTLDLWTEEEARAYLASLLNSPVALDTTQADSLKVLLKTFDYPDEVKEIKMKETAILAADALVESERPAEAARLFTSPADVLRYLWYKHTGYLQVRTPATLLGKVVANQGYRYYGAWAAKQAEKARKEAKDKLKLKFSRTECRIYATWLNGLSMPAEQQCESMHPKREIWVRVIRALRLVEYSKKRGFEKLAAVLKMFHAGTYKVWQGQYDAARLSYNEQATFSLLKERPGVFARQLFANMLWFGPDLTLREFGRIRSKLPGRLILSLNMYAEYYFRKDAGRTVRPLGGSARRIPANRMLQLYADEDLQKMQAAVTDLTREVVLDKFLLEKTESQTLYVDPVLYNMPLAIGERSSTINELPSALMGMRFPLRGDKVRLFMQWGSGLPAQHLDMDLSCQVVYKDRTDVCSYYKLQVPGCKHSGDIQHIPEKKGTAEYIDLALAELLYRGARYVIFTCNAFTSGELALNMNVGWMNSKLPMTVTAKGVAYNPADVQHQVTITQSQDKGLVFGVLDVAAREIIWLEMPFNGQVSANLDLKAVQVLLEKLESRITIGELLELKAEAQGLQLLQAPEKADEVYDGAWAKDAARVAATLL